MFVNERSKYGEKEDIRSEIVDEGSVVILEAFMSDAKSDMVIESIVQKGNIVGGWESSA